MEDALNYQERNIKRVAPFISPILSSILIRVGLFYLLNLKKIYRYGRE